MSGGLVRVALAATVVVAAVAGCSGGEVSQLPPAPTAATSVASSTWPTATVTAGSGLPATTVGMRPAGQPSAADRTVLAAYQRFWQALGPAYTTGDLTALRAATVEPATSRYTKVARDLRAKQRTLRGSVSLAPLVAGRGTTMMTVIDCADLRRFRTYDRTGKPVFPVDEGLTAAQIRLQRVGTGWRVADVVERQNGCRGQGG